jgi:hypothetical protein
LQVSVAVRERESARARAAAVGDEGNASRVRGVPSWVLPTLVVLGIALRVWRVQSNGLDYDETFTAMAARLPLGDLLSYLRHFDSHPPLDYLLRAPLARAGASDFWLRLPSLVFSCAALALFAWWMRARGWIGVFATGFMAVSVFQLVYGGEARMYALLQLLGVAAAMLAERWLRAPAQWHAWAAGGLVLVALFDHISGTLLAAGLLALVGVRGDRDAWRWRGAVAGAGVVWLALWGPSMLDQVGGRWAAWIPRTTIGGFAETVSRQITLAPYVAPVVVTAVAVGGVLLWRSDRVLGRVWIALGALPFALAALIGVFASFLFDRTLTLASWAPPLALAVVLDLARRRGGLLGRACVVGSLTLAVALACSYLGSKSWQYDQEIGHLDAVARSGDVVAVRPTRYGILADWRIGVRGAFPAHAVTVPGLPDVDALALGNRVRTGRIWLLTAADDTSAYAGFTRCAPAWTDGPKKVLCLQR